MQAKYFEDTGTLYIEFQAHDIAESKDLDENTLLDLDGEGNVCDITFEHASTRTELGRLTAEGMAA